MMMILLWILSAQPLVFAVIFAVRGYRESTRVKAKRQNTYRTSLPARRGSNINPIVAD